MPAADLLTVDGQPVKKRRIEFAADVIEIPAISKIPAQGVEEAARILAQDKIEECAAVLQKLAKGKLAMSQEVSGPVLF